VGFIPLIGDLIDCFYKANTYNTLVFQRYLDPWLRIIIKLRISHILVNDDNGRRGEGSFG